jgi:hypothetical protein
MEIKKLPFNERLAALFLKDKIPFTYKADVNWKTVKKCLFISAGVGLVILLFLPTSEPETGFHEQLQPDSAAPIAQSTAMDPTEEAIRQMSPSNPSTPNPYSARGGGGEDRAASMILKRGGFNSKTEIPAGSRIAVRLAETAIVETTTMPVIGIVTQDFVKEGLPAVPAGSKLFGLASLNGDTGRAQVDWRSVQLPNGRERPLTAISIGQDGQLGVEGAIHSSALKNSVGATLTRFIGAYAEGSIETGTLGAGPGGRANGLKNAVAETAKEQANEFAEDLKKEKRWIELNPQTEFFAVLTNNFLFRDPGN